MVAAAYDIIFNLRPIRSNPLRLAQFIELIVLSRPLVAWDLWQLVQHLDSALRLDVLRQLLELPLHFQHLLLHVPYGLILRRDLGLVPLVLLLHENDVFLEQLLLAADLEVHLLQLAQALLGLEQLFDRFLLVFSFFLLGYVFETLDQLLGLAELVALVFDLVVVLVKLLHNNGLLLLHHLLLLQNDLGHPLLNPVLDLLDLLLLGLLRLHHHVLHSLVFILKRLDDVAVLSLLLLENVDLFLFLLHLDLSVGYFVDQFFVFFAELDYILNFLDVLLLHNLQFDGVLPALLSLNH